MLPQAEMFALFQRHRVGMLAWIKSASDAERSRVLRRVVRLVTSSSGDAPPSLLDSGASDEVHAWVELPAAAYAGCWLPEAELADWRARLRRNGEPKTFKQFLEQHTEAMGGTEINMQTGRFTTHSNAMILLPDAAGNDPDFIEAFGAAAAGSSRAQCIQVARTEARQWLQMVGKHW